MAVNPYILAGIIFVVLSLGGLFFFVFYLITRKKKVTWKAKVYQLAAGIEKIKIVNKGVFSGELELRDLKPYAIDTLQMVEKQHGIIIYKLLKLGFTTPAVTNDCVERWGKKNDEVCVLYYNNQCTLLRKGYDNRGHLIFQPLPYERVNMITHNIIIRKERWQKEQSILQAISPWISVGIAILGFIAMIYVGVQGFIEISNSNKEATMYLADKMEASSNTFKDILVQGGYIYKGNVSDIIQINNANDENIKSIVGG